MLYEVFKDESHCSKKELTCIAGDSMAACAILVPVIWKAKGALCWDVNLDLIDVNEFKSSRRW